MHSYYLFFFIFFVVASAYNKVEYQNKFLEWMHQHKKTYHHEEFQKRYSIFTKNLDYIEEFNRNNKHMTLKMNHLGDLTSEEFQSFRGTPIQKKLSAKSIQLIIKQENITANFSWVDQGAVTSVKNQLQCGSCYTFSTTGAIEACNFIKGRGLISLSEQNLVDCSFEQGNDGCNGGLMTQAMDYILANGGIDTESSYPYKGEEGLCQYIKQDNGVLITGYEMVNEGDEDDLLNKAQLGTVSVAIDASNPSFQFYHDGIYFDPHCSSENLDHGVLLVGWGSNGDGRDYWIVKNSWGTSWGKNGYIWMARNQNNHCGIATMGTLPKC